MHNLILVWVFRGHSRVIAIGGADAKTREWLAENLELEGVNGVSLFKGNILLSLSAGAQEAVVGQALVLALRQSLPGPRLRYMLRYDRHAPQYGSCTQWLAQRPPQ